MSEKYRPPEAEHDKNEKETTHRSRRAQLYITELMRKYGEVLKLNEREPPPGTQGDDAQQANPAATDDANQNNGQSDSTTSATQSDNQQKKIDDEQLERDRQQELERVRAEIVEAYAEGDMHASFRPGQS